MKTNTAETPAVETLPALCERLKIHLTVIASGAGCDNEGKGHGQFNNNREWPHLFFQLSLSRDDRAPFWSGPYKMGTAHAKLEKINPDSFHTSLTSEERNVLYTMKSRPHATILWQPQYKTLLEKAIQLNKIVPDVAGVMHSLLMDGAAWFDDESFEDWCSNYGYDEDSRTAEATFQACRETGRQVKKGFTPAELEQLREAASEF